MSTGAIGFPGRMPTADEVQEVVSARTPAVPTKVTRTAAIAAAREAAAKPKRFVKPLLRVDEDPEYVPVVPLPVQKAAAKAATKPAAKALKITSSTGRGPVWGSPVTVSKSNVGPTLTKMSAEGKTIFSIITSPDVQNSYVVFYYS